jgi:hypothetical protein
MSVSSRDLPLAARGPGRLQRLDTSHVLDGDGPEPVARYNGIAGLLLVPAWKFQLGLGHEQPRCGLRPDPSVRETMMRFYNQPHRFYCGVDHHVRSPEAGTASVSHPEVAKIGLPEPGELTNSNATRR